MITDAQLTVENALTIWFQARNVFPANPPKPVRRLVKARIRVMTGYQWNPGMWIPFPEARPARPTCPLSSSEISKTVFWSRTLWWRHSFSLWSYSGLLSGTTSPTTAGPSSSSCVTYGRLWPSHFTCSPLRRGMIGLGGPRPKFSVRYLERMGRQR